MFRLVVDIAVVVSEVCYHLLEAGALRRLLRPPLLPVLSCFRVQVQQPLYVILAGLEIGIALYPRILVLLVHVDVLGMQVLNAELLKKVSLLVLAKLVDQHIGAEPAPKSPLILYFIGVGEIWQLQLLELLFQNAPDVPVLAERLYRVQRAGEYVLYLVLSHF